MVGGRHGCQLDQVGNIFLLTDVGQTRDIAGAKTGLGFGKTYEAAKQAVEDGTPELMDSPQQSALIR